MAASKSTKPISNEIRSLIHNVLCFCEMEKEIGGAAIPYNRAVARTAVMTGVSEKSVYRIKKEMSDLESSLPTGTLAMANKQVMKDSIRKKTKKNINSVSNKKSYRQNKITQPAESDNTQVKNETAIEVVPSVVEEDIAADVSPQRPQVVKKILKRLDAPPQISISDRKIVIVKRDSKNQINNQQLFLLKQNPKTQSDCIQPVCEAPPASKQNDDAIVIPKIITMLPGKVLHKGSNQPVITFKNPQNTTENVHQKIENKNKIIALKSLPVTAQQITLVKKSKEDIVHLPNESQKIPSGLVQAKVVQSQRLRDISKDSKIVLMNDQHNTPDLKKIPDTVIQKVLENIRSTMPGNKKQKIYVKILVKNPPKDVNDAVEEQQYQIVNQDSEQIVSEEAIVSKEPVRKAVHPLPLSQARLANPILRKVMLEAGRQQAQGEKRKIVSVTSAANIPMKVIRVSNPVVQ